MAREAPLQLVAFARGDRHAATARVRDALDAAGASLTDVRFFSGVQTVFAFEVPAERLPALQRALLDAELALDDASRASLDRRIAIATTEVSGTLAVTFVEGDPDLTHDVPAVPG